MDEGRRHRLQLKVAAAASACQRINPDLHSNVDFRNWSHPGHSSDMSFRECLAF